MLKKKKKGVKYRSNEQAGERMQLLSFLHGQAGYTLQAGGDRVMHMQLRNGARVWPVVGIILCIPIYTPWAHRRNALLSPRTLLFDFRLWVWTIRDRCWNCTCWRSVGRKLWFLVKKVCSVASFASSRWFFQFVAKNFLLRWAKKITTGDDEVISTHWKWVKNYEF